MTISRRDFFAAAAGAAALASQGKAVHLVIDAHCHAGHGVRMLAPWSTRADLEVTLRHMTEAGIHRTIIFPIENPGYEKANEEIAEICGRYPKKFMGFARHDQSIEGGRIARMLKREVQSLGLKGLKMIGRPPDHETLDMAADLGVPVLLHASKTAVFRTLAESHPSVQFIIAHLGSYIFQWDENVEAIDLARQYPNIYLDSSTAAFWQIFEMAIKEAGPDKLIFGSDGPEFDSRLALYRIKLLKLPPPEEAKVLGGNITRLLPKGSVES